MTREIKFRGKSLRTGEWLHGDLHHEMEDMIAIRTLLEGTPQTVDETTVGQYTGLKDRNGKEIYEGDILRHTNENLTAAVEEIGGCFQLGIEDDRYIGSPLYLLAPEVYMEIIGNIHDNPDLIK